MKYNIFTWWLSISIKPIIYKIWKYIIVTVGFLGLAVVVAAYKDLFYKYCYMILLPIFLVDVTWDSIGFVLYSKKQKSQDESIQEKSE